MRFDHSPRRLLTVFVTTLVAVLFMVGSSGANSAIRVMGSVRSGSTTLTAKSISTSSGTSVQLVAEYVYSEVPSTIILYSRDQAEWIRSAIYHYYPQRDHRGQPLSAPLISGNCTIRIGVVEAGAVTIALTEGQLTRLFDVNSDNYLEVIDFLNRCIGEIH